MSRDMPELFIHWYHGVFNKDWTCMNCTTRRTEVWRLGSIVTFFFEGRFFGFRFRERWKTCWVIVSIGSSMTSFRVYPYQWVLLRKNFTFPPCSTTQSTMYSINFQLDSSSSARIPVDEGVPYDNDVVSCLASSVTLGRHTLLCLPLELMITVCSLTLTIWIRSIVSWHKFAVHLSCYSISTSICRVCKLRSTNINQVTWWNYGVVLAFIFGFRLYRLWADASFLFTCARKALIPSSSYAFYAWSFVG